MLKKKKIHTLEWKFQEFLFVYKSVCFSNPIWRNIREKKNLKFIFWKLKAYDFKYFYQSNPCLETIVKIFSALRTPKSKIKNDNRVKSSKNRNKHSWIFELKKKRRIHSTPVNPDSQSRKKTWVRIKIRIKKTHNNTLWIAMSRRESWNVQFVRINRVRINGGWV